MPISTSNSSYRPSNRARPTTTPTPTGRWVLLMCPVTATTLTHPPAHFNPPQQQQTQQIFIPNSLVGSIIGKGGNKINEIRLRSQAHIKIMEPDAAPPASGGNENERMVTITGQPHSIQFAVQLLSQVSIESLDSNTARSNEAFLAFGDGKRKAAADANPAPWNVN